MFDDELRVCPKCGGTKSKDEFCPTCERRFADYRKRKMQELDDMAFRRKPATNDPDEVAKLKQLVAEGADAVEKAAKNLVVPMDVNLGNDWEQAKSRVNRMDQEFNNLGDIDVRVMQIGPDGRLTDVSDRVNPRDIRPEQIEGFQSSDNSVRLPRRPSGEIDHEATLDLMAQLVGINRQIRQELQTGPSPEMRKMEVLLAESDTLLKKLRR